jgi:DNA-binding LytR/AlgR family response regulator
MLNAIAIDDEPMALEVVKRFSEKIIFIRIESYFSNALQAMDFLKHHPVDLIFLDIKMPDISGMEMIRAMNNPPMVIFTTAYSEYAVESFELDTVDYLLKPFSLSRFLRACNKAYSIYNLRQHHSRPPEPLQVYIKSGYEQVRINLQDILYAESSGNYVVFVQHDRKIASRLTMSEAEALLPETDFARVHRSFIVARKHIHKADRKNIWVGPTEIPIGAAYKAVVERIIK